MRNAVQGLCLAGGAHPSPTSPLARTLARPRVLGALAGRAVAATGSAPEGRDRDLETVASCKDAQRRVGRAAHRRAHGIGGACAARRPGPWGVRRPRGHRGADGDRALTLVDGEAEPRPPLERRESATVKLPGKDGDVTRQAPPKWSGAPAAAIPGPGRLDPMRRTTWRARLRRAANRLLAPFDLELVTARDVRWWTHSWTFRYGGRTYPLFCHAHNCGWPPYSTERAVELALADHWLGQAGTVMEVGAVTPYYWPGRVRDVVDPADPHPAVTDRRPIADLDLRRRTVLSISTIEHVGTGEYGLGPTSEAAPEACRRLLRDAARFLVTVPVGQNPALDDFLFAPASLPPDVSLGCLKRGPAGTWSQVPAEEARGTPYGDPRVERLYPGTTAGRWANAVVVLERGGLL